MPKIPGSICQEDLAKCSLGVENTEKGKKEELCVPEAVYSKNQNDSIKVLKFTLTYFRTHSVTCV